MGAQNALRPVYLDLEWSEAPPPEYTVIQRKYDGRWVEVRCGYPGVAMLSRPGRVIVDAQASTCAGPPLIGEYIFGTGEAKRSRHKGNVVMFDAYTGGRETYTERRVSLKRRCDELWKVPNLPVLIPVEDVDTDLAGAMDRAESQGWEGLIFRDPDAPYFAPIYRMIRRPA